MDNQTNKLADLISKMDDKVMKIKMNKALDMLNKGDTDEIMKKLKRVDTSEIMEKLEDFDVRLLSDLKIDKDELLTKMDSPDLEKVKKALGSRGDELFDKIKNILK